jgi:hypothetical protein
MHKRNVVLLGMLLGCVAVAQADTTTTTLQGVNNPTLTLSTLHWGDITLNIGGQYVGAVNNGVLSLTETTGGSLGDALFSLSFSQPMGSLGIQGLSLYGNLTPAPIALPVLDTPVPDAILPVVDGSVIGGDVPVIEETPAIIEETPPILEASPDPAIINPIVLENSQAGQPQDPTPQHMPEPATLVYMGLTGAVAAIVRRRKK